MIFETGRVVATEAKGLWVETIQRSTCGSCQAQKGCGHSLLANLGAKASHLWVLSDGQASQSYNLGDEVCIGVPEDIVARGAVFIYIVPLVTMMLATTFAYAQGAGDGVNALAALLGLLAGAAIVRIRAHQTRFDARLQPVLVDNQTLTVSVKVGDIR